jgi:hypothetical protein
MRDNTAERLTLNAEREYSRRPKAEGKYKYSCKLQAASYMLQANTAKRLTWNAEREYSRRPKAKS